MLAAADTAAAGCRGNSAKMSESSVDPSNASKHVVVNNNNNSSSAVSESSSPAGRDDHHRRLPADRTKQAKGQSPIYVPQLHWVCLSFAKTRVSNFSLRSNSET